jgi:ADP-ribose pyrophosphatase YjhB (NUDIX family)
VLMCRRAQDPARGKWTVPSGFLECGETLEEGAARETFEEAGVIVDPAHLELQAVVNMVAIGQVAVGFRIEVTSLPTLHPGPECLEAAFFAEEQLPPDELAWRVYMGNSTERWFSEIRSRDYSIRLGALGSNQSVEFKSREYKIEPVADV